MIVRNKGLWFGLLAFTVSFSIWVIYAAIGIQLRQDLGINSIELGILLASPVLTGALLSIPAGFLAQRFNSKNCFALQMLACLPPLFILPHAQSFVEYFLLGMWLGIAGTSFTFGISYVQQTTDQRQGFAMGIFGAGNAGAVITLGLSPWLIETWGFSNLGPAFALLAGTALLLFWVFAPNPDRKPLVQRPPSSLLALLSKLQIWRFGLYYFFVFGSFLALTLWLPSYYNNSYQLNNKQALAFTLVFVGISSSARAVGGWLTDRYGGRTINWSVFWVCLVCLFFLSYPTTTMTIHGIDKDVALAIQISLWPFSLLIWVMAVALGFGRASVVKLIHDYYPEQLPQVMGIVVALGAVGACILPIAFGAAEQLMGFYSASFMLLYALLALCMIVMHFANKADRQQGRFVSAVENNFLEFD